MSNSLLQITVDEHLKDDASKVFEDVGMDISSAVRLFLIHVVEHGFPFQVLTPKYSYISEQAYRALLMIQEEAQRNGTSDMSLEEINAEIDASRKGTSCKL